MRRKAAAKTASNSRREVGKPPSRGRRKCGSSPKPPTKAGSEATVQTSAPQGQAETSLPPEAPPKQPPSPSPASEPAQASTASALEVTRAEALRILVCPDRTFAKLEADGIVTPARRGRPGQASVYDLRDLVPAYLRHVVNGKPSDERAARAKRDLKQAEKLDLEISTKRGELVALSDVVLAGQNFVKAWTAMVRSLPRQMVQEGLIPREQESGVLRLCLEILTEISKWQTVADTAAAASKGAAA